MGLDSVELVMEIENYFSIRIPDKEAEKIYTVQMMVDCVAGHLSISNNDFSLRDTVVEKIQNALIKLQLTETSLPLNDTVFTILPINNNTIWNLLETEIGLSIPKPIAINEPNLAFWNIFNSTPFYNHLEITLEQFVDIICANNYAALIDPNHIKSTYEIQTIVTGLTYKKIGVNIYEITPEKSFTKDLGIE